MKNKTIICVAGRSGAGKDSITSQVAKHLSIPIVCSFTDRPIRPTEENGREHIFKSTQEMNKICQHQEELLAYTKIGDTGYRYCVPKDYINQLPGDVVFYVIDPNGIQYLKENNPEYQLSVISIQADEDIRRLRAYERNGDISSYEKRIIDENEQFDTFESNSNNYDICISNNGNINTAIYRMEEFIREIIHEKEEIEIEK